MKFSIAVEFDDEIAASGYFQGIDEFAICTSVAGEACIDYEESGVKKLENGKFLTLFVVKNISDLDYIAEQIRRYEEA